jgi:hypothetical protein
MKKERGIIRRANTAEFFRTRIHNAINHSGVETSEMAEFYIVNLLDQYREVSKLFADEGDGPVLKPLALILDEAERADALARRACLKKLGDTALYIAGFFTDHVHKSLVNLDYYISMGGTAYCTLSTLQRKRAIQELYYELATKFSALVRVIADVSPWSQHIDNQRLVRLYAMWLESGDERIEAILKREGIDTDDEQRVINP